MLAFPFPYLRRQKFTQIYDCALISQMGEKYRDMENGGKMVLPSSAIGIKLQSYPVPLLFKVTNTKNLRYTHVGILDFSAEENCCYVPDWMVRTLHLEEIGGGSVKVEQVSLPVAKLIKFKPFGGQFMALKNPIVLLNLVLNRFSCLTRGDIISIHFNHNTYQLRVVDTKPGGGAVSISLQLMIELVPSEEDAEADDDEDLKGHIIHEQSAETFTSDTDRDSRSDHDDDDACRVHGLRCYFEKNVHCASWSKASSVRSILPLRSVLWPRSYSHYSVHNLLDGNSISENEEVD